MHDRRLENLPLDSGDRLVVDDHRGVRSVPLSEVKVGVNVDQPGSNPQAAGYALSATDIGNVVFATGAGAQAFTLPSLASALISGRMLILTIQCEGAATEVTITPGGSSQIDGAGVGVDFEATVGRSRISLFSRDGLNWFSGTP